MISDQNRVYDGWISLEGGMDGGRAPNMLEANQCANAINMTFRGGSSTTRPGFRILDEQFENDPRDQVWCYNQQYTYPVIVGACTFSADFTGNVTPAVPILPPLVAGEKVSFRTTGTLPSTIHPGVQYFVLAVGLTTTSFRISLTAGGTKITFPTAGTGVHTIWRTTPPTFVTGEYKPEYIVGDGTLAWFENENSEYIYRHGKLQCAIAYSPHNGEDCIMAMIGGRLFRIVPGVTTARVSEVVIRDAPRSLRNMKNSPIAYMVQADKWMIAQDGISSAIIYDGDLARRSDTTTDVNHTEIPVGTIMAYGMGRLSVVVKERDVAFGDLYGSHDLPDPADSLILFTERNFLAEGFDAAIPFTQGKATGMVFFPQLDTSTGNGQLMVFSERGASSFFLSVDRSQWKTTPGFQTLSLLTTGMRGHRSISVVNEDLWFRADDGVRSFRQARSEQSGWAHIPLSTNVRTYLENDSDWLLRFTSSIYFDNRVIFTTSPMWNQGRPLHWGMVVVDFDILSSFGAKFNPAWEGAWQIQYTDEFVLPTQLLTGTFKGSTRAFVFAINASNQNQLYELSRDDRDDFDNRKINWEFESRTLDFMKMTQAPTPFTENELYDGDVWLKEIED